MSLKLLVDKRNQTVLFAEADKDFVDFLFSLLHFPLATVVRLLSTNEGMQFGSIDNLSSSLENLDDSYMQPNLKGSNAIHRKPKEPALPNKLGLLTNIEFPNTTIYSCPNSKGHNGEVYVSHDPCACRSRGCGCEWPRYYDNVVTYLPTKEAPVTNKETGFVKDSTYIVTDELEVKPNCSIASIFHLAELDVPVRDLEEMNVEVGEDEGVKLLKESMQSRSVLTNVFLKGKQHEDVKPEI